MALRCAQIPLNAAMHIDPKKLDMKAGSSLAGQEGLDDENTSHTRFLRPVTGRRVTHLQYRETSLGLQHMIIE